MTMDDATGFSNDGGGGCNLNMNNPASGKLVGHDEILSKPVEPTWKDVTKQILACCIASLTVVQVGLNMSFSAVLLPDLESGENVQKISKSEASWIASILVLSTPIGSILSGPICDKIGRKRGNMLTCVPTVFAWGIIALSSGSVYGLYLARILAGLGGGMTTIFIVYASEICHEKYRPMLLSLNSIAVALGIMIVTINGVHMHWKTMALIYGILTFVTFFLNWFFTPESPFWLMMLSKKSGNRIEAEKALKQLNPNKQIYMKKLEQVLESSRKLEETRNNKKNEKEFFKKFKKFLMNILLPETLLPLLLLTGLLSLQQLSGGYSIIFYTIHVFKKLGGNFGGGIDEYDALLMLGIIRFIMSIVAGVLARLIGRRPLLITSSLGMAISSFLITLYQNYFKINTTVEYSTFVPQIDTENKINSSINFIVNKTTVLFYNNTNDFHSNDQTTGDWFPMVCILLFISAGSIGLLNIPWTLMGEMLPTSIRGIGSGFIVSFGYMVMFITIKIYPFLLDSLGVGNLFLIQGIVCLIIIIFTYLFIPETLGKSLNEIEKYFSKRKIIYTKN